MLSAQAKFSLGQVVRHRVHPFRGVIFDVDPTFNNTNEWWEAIPEESRPNKDQPFYHLLAENETSYYVAYVSEQNLVSRSTIRKSPRCSARCARVAATTSTATCTEPAGARQPRFRLG